MGCAIGCGAADLGYPRRETCECALPFMRWTAGHKKHKDAQKVRLNDKLQQPGQMNEGNFLGLFAFFVANRCSLWAKPALGDFVAKEFEIRTSAAGRDWSPFLRHWERCPKGTMELI